MKKIMFVICGLVIGMSLIAGPPRGGRGGGHHHHHHGGPSGLRTAADIVSICANGLYIANQLGGRSYYYNQPVYYSQPAVQYYPQPVYQQPVYVQPQPVYVQPQPVQYYTPVVYEPSTVIVRERRPFILTRIIDAVLP